MYKQDAERWRMLWRMHQNANDLKSCLTIARWDADAWSRRFTGAGSREEILAELDAAIREQLSQAQADARDDANLLTDIAQILNVVREEWLAVNSWSEWDQNVCDRITSRLATFGPAPEPLWDKEWPDEKPRYHDVVSGETDDL